MVSNRGESCSVNREVHISINLSTSCCVKVLSTENCASGSNTTDFLELKLRIKKMTNYPIRKNILKKIIFLTWLDHEANKRFG